MKNKENPPCLSISETCALLGLGRTKLYQIIGSGTLPAKKIGKRTVIIRDDLDAFLSNLQSYSPENKGGKNVGH